ncbi:MAG TPA: exodeoxyribonuclease VII large subunit [Anaerolineaceae bacterium]|nr:exodeoxyribonuclease VII large subunit [Anaerolineaceae bacterium]
MLDFSLPTPTILSITSLTNYLREVLESDPVLQDLWVRGEISNFSSPKSGHLYFSLKDADSQMRCVIWKGAALRLHFQPRDGQLVEAHGSMSVYPAGGTVQLYIDELRPAGEGQLFAEFMRLKSKLEGEGLFDQAHKRPIPAYPSHIGVVTSATGAALRDILDTLARRRPDLKVSIAPSAVQGVDAPKEILIALNALTRRKDLDLIILARGGGSIEDLWAFNDEALARAVYNSPIPVITGVGHETDFTLVDFVSDLRAPTPTAAAERASSITRDDLLINLSAFQQQLQTATLNKIQVASQSLQLARAELRRTAPLYRVGNALQRLDDLRERLDLAVNYPLRAAGLKLSTATAQMNALNPRAVLSRGYAILTDKSSGRVLSSIKSAFLGQETLIQLQDGSLDANITSIDPGEIHDRKN